VQHAEAVEPGHLHVEQEQIDGQPLQHFHRLDAVAALGDDVDVVATGEQDSNRRARIRLVVDDRHAQHHCPGAVPSRSGSGSTSVAHTPVASFLSSRQPAGFRARRRSITFFKP